MRVALLAAAAATAASTGPLAGAVGVTTGTDLWSAPATLGACPASAAPQVVFPSDSPSQGTGAGALVWGAAASCAGGAGARVAMIGAAGMPAAEAIPRAADGHPLAPRAPLAASGGPDGHVVIAGAAPGPRGGGLLVEGAAGGRFARVPDVHFAAAPLALSTAYLGDVALAAPARGGGAGASRIAGGGLSVRVQRHYERRFGAGIAVSGAGGAPVRALALALDFRSDALVVWAQGATIYARELPASGARQPVQRLGLAGGRARVAALLSDDDRAIVAWSEQRGRQTSVYLDRSATGVRFGAPLLLERFEDPAGAPAPSGSPRLVRLSSESVMMAWAGAAAGRWVVRTAAIDRTGTPVGQTIAPRGADALLEDLAPGPDGDALVLWSEPQQGEGGVRQPARRAIFAARGTDAYPGRTIFGPAEQVAPAGPNSEASVALDPDSDRALAAWRGAGGAIEYAVRGLAPLP